MTHLTRQEKSSIEQKVEQIKLDTGLAYPENNLLEIASSLGVDVLSADLPDFQEKKVKGYIKWLPESERGNAPYRARIYLNSNQSDTTKNFTLAHELGHFLLHKDESNFRIDLQDYSEEDADNQETEANFFAGCLLMPKDKLIIALNNAKSFGEVARSFGVSIPAVKARINWIPLKLAS